MRSENKFLTSLLDVESLRSRFDIEPATAVEMPMQSPADFLKADRLAIPGPDLEFREIIHGMWQTPMAGPAPASARQAVNENLMKLYRVFSDDVALSRERLTALNPGRRTQVERRVESIARTISTAKGERFQRQVSLAELLKHTPRSPDSTIAQAWRSFLGEVALYNLFELFLLKSLDFHGRRDFQAEDIRRLNFSVHAFLMKHAIGFTQDVHCWNFVRNNLYSWYVPSSEAAAAVEGLLTEIDTKSPIAWSETDFAEWLDAEAKVMGLSHLDLSGSRRTAVTVLDYIEKHLGLPFAKKAAGHTVFPKVFLPSLGGGGLAPAILGRMLDSASGSLLQDTDSASAQTLQMQNALWACESESIEVHWAEVASLLKLLSCAGADSARAPGSAPASRLRIPHVVRAVNLLGLELHNLDQMPLSGPGLAALHHGTAGRIQTSEAFDLAVVLDRPERARSQRWIDSLIKQRPYWKAISGAGTNWGEMHLTLAMSKMKDGGVCVMFSHKALPTGRDGERLRKTISALGCLVEQVELAEPQDWIKWVHVFKRVEDKSRRDAGRARWATAQSLDLEALERATFNASPVTHSEVAEHGLERIRQAGSSPLLRKLEARLPKLGMCATIQTGKEVFGPKKDEFSLFTQKGAARTIFAWLTNEGVKFREGSHHNIKSHGEPTWVITPHNTAEMDGLICHLKSSLVASLIRQAVEAAEVRVPRIQDLKQIPIPEFSSVDPMKVALASEWLGSHIADEPAIGEWALAANADSNEISARFLAFSKRQAALKRILARYRPLFSSIEGTPELAVESVPHFYPERMLVPLGRAPEARVQFVGREHQTLAPEAWTVTDISSLVQGKKAVLSLSTRSRGRIQITIPAGVEGFATAQIRALIGQTWAELCAMVRIPIDVQLYVAQTHEISRVLMDTVQESTRLTAAIDRIIPRLFGIDPS